jgi:nucleoside-diphosphate-sugar epimerase
MTTRVLITGGAGYIGSVLTQALLGPDPHETSEFDVVVVDNFMWNQTSLNHLCGYLNLEIVKGDCRDMRIMGPLLDACDVFIPLAALVGAPLCEQWKGDAESINLFAIAHTINLLSLNQRVLIPNTNSGYGTVKNGECTEETPFNPISVYGTTKAEAEEFVLNRPNAVSFRLATVFGMSPRMRMDLLVNDFVWRAMTDGYVVLYEPNAMRNYIHIRDVARVFLHGIRTKLPDGAYNVGLSNANLSKADLCKEIQKQFPTFEVKTSLFGMDPDKRDYVVSNAKIEKSGFSLRFDLAEGIMELRKGYQQFRRYSYGNI